MVFKFKQREQTYTQLLTTVSDSEARVDMLKRDNEELSKRLHDLKIDSGETIGGGADTQDSEIIGMTADLTNV